MGRQPLDREPAPTGRGRWLLVAWILGLALGVWIGNHAHEPMRGIPVIDSLAGTALLIGSGLVLLWAWMER